MAIVRIDALGLVGPHPVLKIAAKVPDLASGDILEVLGDSPTFEREVRIWCERMNKKLLETAAHGTSATLIKIEF